MATVPNPQNSISLDPTYHEGGHGDAHGGTGRRDFLYIATGMFAAAGATVAIWPLVNQMAPSADVLALASIEADLSKIEAGQAVKLNWRGKPVFARHLTPAEIAEADKVNIAELRDPETLASRTKPGNKQWLITMGVCTHLGCVPLGAGQGETKGQYGGYFCPCHGSMYDTAARIRKGPAPKNLEVPVYAFKTPTTIQIG